jgi:hypothetical protein
MFTHIVHRIVSYLTCGSIYSMILISLQRVRLYSCATFPLAWLRQTLAVATNRTLARALGLLPSAVGIRMRLSGVEFQNLLGYTPAIRASLLDALDPSVLMRSHAFGRHCGVVTVAGPSRRRGRICDGRELASMTSVGKRKMWIYTAKKR